MSKSNPTDVYDKRRKLFKPMQASRYFGVTTETLRRWESKGLIYSIRANNGTSGQRLYDIDSYGRFYDTKKETKKNEETGKHQTDKTKVGFCYCRVSTTKQKDDLHRQEEFLKEKFPEYEVVSDIGSGLNFKRPGILKLLARAINGDVKEVVVAHKDRMCRFGFQLLEWLFEHCGSKIVVLDESDQASPEQELCKDVLSIINVFSSRINGRRKYKKKENEEDVGNTTNTTL
jgi:putative resolvase